MQIEDIKNYDDLVDIVYDNENFIERNYHSKEDQTLIHKELVIKIIDYLKKPIYENLDKNEILKTIARDVLELSINDVIIIKKNYIFIKIYNDNKRYKVKSDEVNTSAGRYNGIDESELKDFYDEYYSDNDIEELFLDISDIFVEKYFLETHISNYAYEKEVFKLIQKLIIEDLEAEFDCSKEFSKGFAGYIFRIHFKLVFQYIAELILKEVAYSNKHIIEFLKYYSLDVVVMDGKRYKVPELITEDGLKWNVVSMMAMVKTYIKTEEYILETENEINKLDNKISSLYVGDLSPIEHNKLIQENYIRIEEKIKLNSKRMNKVQDSLAISKNENNNIVLKKELEKFKNERVKLIEQKTKIQNKRVNQKNITQYQDFRKNIVSLLRGTTAKYKILKQNDAAFQSIKSALVKALISKKRLV